MHKVIRNIQTEINGEEIGTLVIIWDMVAVETEVPPSDVMFWQHGTEEKRSVKTIHTMELQIFDKVGLDMTYKVKADGNARNLVERKLISWAADKDLRELGSVATEDTKLTAATLFTSKNIAV